MGRSTSVTFGSMSLPRKYASTYGGSSSSCSGGRVALLVLLPLACIGVFHVGSIVMSTGLVAPGSRMGYESGVMDLNRPGMIRGARDDLLRDGEVVAAVEDDARVRRRRKRGKKNRARPQEEEGEQLPGPVIVPEVEPEVEDPTGQAPAVAQPGVVPASQGTAGMDPAPEKVASWTHDAVYPRLRTVHVELAENMKRHNDFEGNSNEVEAEVKAYLDLGLKSSFKTVCEIGVNGGHSSATWIMGNKHMRKLYLFDLGQHAYVQPAVERLRILARDVSQELGRDPNAIEITYTAGDSTQTLPAFHAAHPEVVCDMFHIDGGHFGDVPRVDIQNALKMMRPGSIAVLDDYDPTCVGVSSAGCDRPTAEWDAAVRAGKLRHLTHTVAKQYRGWAFGEVL